MFSRYSQPTSRRDFLSFMLLGSSMLFLSPSVLAQAKAPDNEGPIEILPYLQNPAQDAMTVCFLSTAASDVKVECYEKKGSGAKTTRAMSLDIPKTNWKIWKARLTGLKPGVTYHYRVTYTQDKEKKNSEAYQFTTLNWRALETKAIALNDVHDKLNVLEGILKNVKPQDYEFSLLMGDMWNDPSPSNNADRVFRTMAGYVKMLDASNKPMMYIRGNHDTRGSFAEYLSYLFDLPNNNPKDKFPAQNAYYEFRNGPIWFVSPDAGEDGNKRESIFQAYRQRQVGWLKDIFARNPARKAPWKVLTMHIPLFTPRGWDQPDALKRWAPVLDKENIDLMIAGHDHTPHFVEKGKTFERKQDKSPQKPPYPVLVGGGPNMSGGEVGTVMLIDATSRALNVRLVSVTGKVIHTVSLKK